MNETRPPSEEALAFADLVLEFLVGYKTGAVEENRNALAQRIDAFAEQRAAEARQSAIEECADVCRALGHYSGRNVQPAIEQIADAIRALADKPAASNGEWRPIETAPRDENIYVLACRAGSKIPAVLGYDDGGHYWFNGVFRNDVKPTHWRPLPTPPEPREGDG